MDKMGFGQWWRYWIKTYISLAYAVLINGVSISFFKSSRGLRQGDPLSPVLFINVSEMLGRLVQKAVLVDLMLEVSRLGLRAFLFL